ncbi:hypothetical protein [Hyunsoonleella aestuarii]|uniref:Uncharacterized protein n=1 Tax=Hyunsoonleella aestuarii TaxID=912802 RepID=A0ABP8E9K7_9FLAO|nr:hypothetical protein [Hyunsoonleella aestuarii]
MKLNLFFAFLLCLNVTAMWSQVGIGTTDPSAELEIETTNTGIPALQLNPQSAPDGDADGQLAVIGDKLYMYDLTRDKWLSIETTALQYGRNGNVNNQRLRFGGDLRNNSSGPLMPFDGTIVYMTIKSSDGSSTKDFDIKINGTDVGNDTDATLDGRVNLSSGSFTQTEYNIDFDAGDFITLEIRNGSDVANPAGVIWVKWRVDNP